MALQFVSREEWGAKPPRKVTKLDPSNLSGVALHWFGSPSAASSHEGCAALLRSVQNTHMAPGGLGTKGGANDIGYNHAVCPHGLAHTLRGFGVQTGANGNSRANSEYAAVVYMGGEKDGRPVTKEAQPVIAEIIRMWQQKGAGPLVKPHGFFTGSTCPGPDLRKWLDLSPASVAARGTAAAARPGRGREPGLADGLRPLAPRPERRQEEAAEDGTEADSRKRVGGRRPGRPYREPDGAAGGVPRLGRVAPLRRQEGGPAAKRARDDPEVVVRGARPAGADLQGRQDGEAEAPPTATPKPQAETPSDDGVVTPQSALLAPPRATPKTLERYMLSRQHGSYSDDDVRDILRTYTATCKQAGLDPLLVVSQMVLETGNLMSFWSQPPRRNPAGIGVTGKPGAGISFSNWDKAARAHVGRLLAYALPKDGGTEAQRKLIDEALKVRPLPDDRRGRAPKLKGLAGSWATDRKYADKITGIANEIRQRG